MPRRAATPAALIPLTLAGCLGGTPMSAQVKSAARAWTAARLHPDKLQVTLVAVTPDQRRARAHVLADGTRYRLRLRRANDRWRVVAAR
jgi:hypothetical protein